MLRRMEAFALLVGTMAASCGGGDEPPQPAPKPRPPAASKSQLPASASASPQAAKPQRIRTLAEWYNEVPSNTRGMIESQVAQAIEGNKGKAYWEVGNAIYEAVRRFTRKDWVPVIVTVLRKGESRNAAPILHAIKLLEMTPGLTTREELEKSRPLDGVLAEELLPFVTHADKDARLSAVKVLGDLAGGGVSFQINRTTDMKAVEYVDAELRGRIKTALETASRDADRTVREAAQEALAELRK